MTGLFESWDTEVRPWENIVDAIAASPPGVLDIDVLRHGETTRNAERRISGSVDVELTERGREQALKAGGELADSYDVAFQSPLGRSQETLALALSAARCEIGTILTDH